MGEGDNVCMGSTSLALVLYASMASYTGCNLRSYAASACVEVAAMPGDGIAAGDRIQIRSICVLARSGMPPFEHACNSCHSNVHAAATG